MEPVEVDRALAASLAPSIASSLRERTGRVVDPVYGFQAVCLGFDVVRQLTPADAPALQQAIALHERAMAPAPDDATLKELGAVRLLTKAKNLSDDDLLLQLRLYARKLAAYPADVVLEVLRTQPDIDEWWPAWHDLQRRLEPRVQQRRARLQALRQLEAGMSA